MNTNTRLLQVEGVTKTFGHDQGITEALRGISFDVLPGEFLGIMGASGSGKTTLLNCIASMLSPTSGKISLRGQDITSLSGKALAHYRGNEIGYLFQNFELLDHLTARENIMLPLAIHRVKPQDSRERLQQLALQLDITSILDQFPDQMSGGEKQRVAAARALINNPSMILADEPTGALDSKNAKVLMQKLSAINQENNTAVLMVTHDPNAASFCSRILFIQDGMLFHELRRNWQSETQAAFYERVLAVLAQLGGGSAYVL